MIVSYLNYFEIVSAMTEVIWRASRYEDADGYFEVDSDGICSMKVGKWEVIPLYDFKRIVIRELLNDELAIELKKTISETTNEKEYENSLRKLVSVIEKVSKKKLKNDKRRPVKVFNGSICGVNNNVYEVIDIAIDNMLNGKMRYMKIKRFDYDDFIKKLEFKFYDIPVSGFHYIEDAIRVKLYGDFMIGEYQRTKLLHSNALEYEQVLKEIRETYIDKCIEAVKDRGEKEFSLGEEFFEQYSFDEAKNLLKNATESVIENILYDLYEKV